MVKRKKMTDKINDEYYTPAYAVFPILKYIPANSTVWCPFDKSESQFVVNLIKTGHTVIYTHIDDGTDFFKYEPPYYDIVVSNPPFSLKKEIISKLLDRNKPFALLMSAFWLNYKDPKLLFKDKDLQLLMFDRRVQYKKGGSVPFSSCYYCYNILPKQIIMESLTLPSPQSKN